MATERYGRTALVFNPRAGAGRREEIGDIVGLLVPDGGPLAEPFDLLVLETTEACSGTERAREALARGCDLIIAAGGDGTVSQVASALVGTEASLGVVPRGTANSFAAALGIPPSVEEACAFLRTGTSREIDTAVCAGRTMVLHATVGAHAEVIGGTRREAKNRWGALAYVATATEKLLSLEPFDVTLESDAHVIRCKAVAVTVANLASVRTLVAQGPAEVRGDDALLDVTIVASTGLLDAVAAGAHLLRTALAGEPAQRDDIGYFACQRVRIVADAPQPLLVDGETAGTTPATIHVVPRSLRVVAPQPAAAATGPGAKLVGLPAIEIQGRASNVASRDTDGPWQHR